MSKSICALVHRPDSTRAAFQTYYEENHAPLGARHFPFTRYVRNHLLDAEDLGYDTISEFWADDIEACAALMNGPTGEILRADEAKFMDQSRIAPAGAEEHILSAGSPAGQDGARTAFLIRSAMEDEGWRDIALSWGRAVAVDRPGVSLDFVTSWREPAFPAAAILWMPGAVEPTQAPGAITVRRVKVRRIETPADQLLAAQASHLNGADC